MKNTIITTIKAAIKGLTFEKVSLTQSRQHHKKNVSSESKSTEWYQEWFVNMDERRRLVRYQVRHHLLAYGLVRERAYREIERNSISRPDVRCISKILMSHGRDMKTEDIEVWLDTLVKEEAQEAQEVQEAA